MSVAIYSTRPWDEASLTEANTNHDLRLLEAKLDHTTTSLAEGADAVCVFVSDLVDRQVIEDLAKLDVRFLALRSTGFNHIDLAAATEYEITVVRVPAYSPHAVAEEAVREIAEVTIENFDRLEADEPTGTEVTVDLAG